MNRYTINFSERVGRIMDDLAEATHVTPREVVRDALTVYWWLAQEYGRGTRFMVQRGCSVDELVFGSLKDVGPLPDPGEVAGYPASEETESSVPLTEQDR